MPGPMQVWWPGAPTKQYRNFYMIGLNHRRILSEKYEDTVGHKPKRGLSKRRLRLAISFGIGFQVPKHQVNRP